MLALVPTHRKFEEKALTENVGKSFETEKVPAEKSQESFSQANVPTTTVF